MAGKSKTARFLIAIAVTLLISCRDADETSRARVESELRSRLAVGDTSEKIERVLKEKNIPFSFDRFSSGYQARIDPKEKSKIPRVISVWIHVDQTGRLTNIDVHNSYTFL
jgi:hypothetical protein